MSESGSFSEYEEEEDDSQAIPINELLEFCHENGLEIAARERGGTSITAITSTPLTSPLIMNEPCQDGVTPAPDMGGGGTRTPDDMDITTTSDPRSYLDAGNDANAGGSQQYPNSLPPDAVRTGEVRKRKVRTPTTRDKRRSGWKRNANQQKRMRGEAYIGFNTVKDTVTQRKRTPQTEARQARQMGLPCTSQYCKKNKFRNCVTFSQDQRIGLYNEFWKSMDWGEKKAHVRSLVDQNEPKHAKKDTARRRGKTYTYFLKKEGRRVQVCQKMFLGTLALGKDQVQGWLEGNIPDKQSATQETQKRNKTGGDKEFYKEFLENIPKIPSHYCREKTTKKYLEIVFRTKQSVYDAYKSECFLKGITPTSSCTFHNYFHDQNFALHQPKKDMCDLCLASDAGNADPEEFRIHKIKKDSARAEKVKDKDRALEGKCHVISMDVQKVLLSPMSNASALYFKTKLSIHNFTIFDLATHGVKCYLFDETQAELKSSSFASCVIKFFEERYNDDLPIIIYSDGSTSQNRNGYLSAALLHYAAKYNKEIFQKYLEKGHTQMECDSVHSRIETQLRGATIHVPSDYVKICKDARTNSFGPYDVEYLNYPDFYDFGQFKYNIRPGGGTGDSYVTHLRQLKYTPDGKIYYKLDHGENWTEMPRTYGVDSSFNFPKLYNHRLPITKRKFEDLQSVLHVIPSMHHEYYKSIPHKST